METYSQIGQDLIVLKYLKNKTNGTFVDVGCGYPSYINNTYLLEKKYGWTGISIDLNNYLDPFEVDFEENTRERCTGKSWQELRPKSNRVLANALTLDYEKLFEENHMPETIDFLSLDLEPPEVTFECLFKIPFHKYKFRFIAFETDEYREGGIMRRDESRNYFEKLDYVLVGTIRQQDDFYVHKTAYDSSITFDSF